MTPIRRAFWRTTTALTVCLPAIAHAQTTTPSDPTAEAATASASGDDIVVTGTRAAQRKAIQDKLNANGIQDSVRQDDIGRLPDTTVAEAARRIPGVSVNLLTDNTRGRSEVQRATIRGFDAKYNLVTIDGSQLASIDTAALSNGQITRAFNLNLLPASLVSELVVRKSWVADDDPQALGGQVDLVTRSAFQTKDATYADVTAFGGLDTTSGDSVTGRRPSERASALISHRVDFDGSRLGVVLSADYQNSWSASNGVTIGVPGAANQNSAGWTYYGPDGRSVAGPAQAAGAAVPTRFQAYSFDDHLTHYSVSGKLEYQTDGGFSSSLFAGYFAQDSIETRNEALLTRTASALAGTGAAGTGAPANMTPTSGLFSSNDAELGVTYQPIKQHTSLVNWRTSYQFTPNLLFNLNVAYSEAHGHLFRDMIKYVGAATVSASGSAAGANSPAFAFTYDSSGFVPTVALVTPSNVANPGNFVGLYWRTIDFDETNKVLDAHPSLSWNAGADATGFGLRVGADLTRTTVRYDENYIEYDPKVPSQFLMTAALANSSLTIPTWGGIAFGTIDRSKGDPIPGGNLAAFTAINESANDNANDFNVTEQTAAGYLTATYSSSKLKAQAGVRYNSTTEDLGSNQQVANFVYQPVTSSSAYHKLLPSAVIRYDVTPDIIAHLAFSQTLGRPDFSAYAPLAKVGLPGASGIAVTLGNPDIKPRQTNNYDASVDVYFDHHRSLFSVQYFHKDLKNEFYNLLYSAPYVYNGTTYVGSFTQPRNGASASVNGVELNLQKDKLPILPENLGSLGLSVNFTLMRTNFDIIDATGAGRRLDGVVNQPRDILNATLFYTYRRFDASATFNRQGRTLYQTGAVSWEDTYILARHQLDMSARYHATDRLTLLAEAANVTGESFRSAMGPQKTLVADQYAIGTTLWVGANLKY